LFYAGEFGAKQDFSYVENLYRVMDKLDERNSNIPLIQAISGENVDMNKVNQLLKDPKINVNQVDYAGNTPLHFAGYEDAKLVQLLLAAGADVNAKDQYGSTPLLIAIKEHNHEVVKLLLDAGADVNISEQWGDTPLLIALKENNNEVAKLLLKAGAKVNVANQFGTTPLYFAIIHGADEIVKMLIDAGVNVKDQCFEPLDVAISKPLSLASAIGLDGSKVNIVQLLYDAGASYLK